MKHHPQHTLKESKEFPIHEETMLTLAAVNSEQPVVETFSTQGEYQLIEIS